ncbi:MAG: helix-turn-helix transcriptional regulator [Chloroflexi bacterium]|nr:helix-turn-helix transcriptional regulator [Chloroflexota bacterium]
MARRAGISNGYISQIMAGQRKPSGDVLRRLHEVLFAPSPAELVAPVELRVMGWKKGGRNGMVIRGAGGPGGGTIRTGGRVPWGAEVEFAYTTGYDSRGRLSVTHLVDERGYGVMLNRREPGAT